MNKLIILEYINRLTKEDISIFGLNQGIKLTNNELDTIYDYIKNDNQRILNNPIEVINEVKDKVSYKVYEKLLELYDKYKDFIDKIK